MFFVLNLLNLSSFLLSFMFIFSFYFLLIFKFLLSSLIPVSFCNREVFSSDIHYSIIDKVPYRDEIFEADASSLCTREFSFFWKDFLRGRQVSSDVFSTLFSILGREKRDFRKLAYFCWSLLLFSILKNPSLLFFNFFNSYLNCSKSKFSGFSQDKWLTISRNC